MKKPRRSPSPALALILHAAAVASIASAYYGGALRAALRMAVQEDEYGYLLVGFAALVYAAASSLEGLKPLERLTAGRILAVASLLAASALLYSISLLEDEYTLQLQLFSLVLISWALFLAMLEAVSPEPAAVLPSTLLLVPLPRGFISVLAEVLSRLTAKLASSLSGARLLEASGGIYLIVETPRGAEALAVVTACSGIVSLLAVLASMPLLLYLAASSTGGLARRAAALSAAAAAASLTVFAGNVTRLAAMVVAARHWGAEYALRLLHYTPSPVYAALATAAAYTVACRLLSCRSRGRRRRPIEAWERPWLGLAVGAATAILAALMLQLVAAASGGAAGAAGALPADELLHNAASILFTRAGLEVVSVEAPEGLDSILGEAGVWLVSVRVNGSVYRGYVEVSESPFRFHSWSVCLSMQGYRVTGSESIRLDWGVAHILYIEGRDTRGVLVYTVLSIPADFGYTVKPVYVRISLLYFDPQDPARGLPRLLELLARLTRLSLPPVDYAGVLLAAARATALVMALDAVYIAASMLAALARRRRAPRGSPSRRSG